MMKGENEPYGRRIAMELSAVLTPAPEGGYVAYNSETGTTTQGETLEEAIKNLQEATELYLEDICLAERILEKVRTGEERTWTLEEVEQDLGLGG
jgi:predicted RNase H-like HicB family nuclease